MHQSALAQSSGQGIIVPFINKDDAIADLAEENERLRQEVRNLTSSLRLARQVAEALSDLNRYYASRHFGRYATNTESFLYYMENGGKTAFDQAHPPAG